MSNFKDWLTAARPRTLPLSLACIGMGAFLAASVGKFDTTIFALCVLTTVFLQILSNFSNDYGDTVHGADSKDREGPKRAVQSGAISAKSMKNAITLFSSLSFLAGLSLLWVSFGWNPAVFVVFILLGLLSIYAAITYTSGSRPYGYAGLGDLSVLIFFGLVGVVGTYFLFTKSLSWTVFLPSISCGLFSVAVLNINNVRDIESDKLAGKKSVPVRIGRPKAVIYHWLLLIMGLLSSTTYMLLVFEGYLQFLFVLTFPLFIKNGIAVMNKQNPSDLDPYLKQMALTTLLFVITFGLGLLLG